MTAQPVSVSLTDLDRVLAAVGRHWQDCCEHGDLDGARKDMRRLDSYLEMRFDLTQGAAA